MSQEQQPSFEFPAERAVWTVSALLARLKKVLEQNFFDVWIEGEISNLHLSAARHYYFTLKDSSGQIRAAMFAGQARFLKFRLQDGMQVVVRARLSVYEARGELQCYVEHLEPRGRGSLQLAFEQLKKKLEAEGLFAKERKRPLPLLPRRIALITSPRGAVIADMIRVLRRRYPNMNLLLLPVQVQGPQAAGEIVSALATVQRELTQGEGAVDVVIVGRGGGSLEDLWPFNEEEVARAILACPVPVISAVGHETDFTIADFVADLRAPTPSAAAELVVRPKQDISDSVGELERRLRQGLHLRLLRRRQLLHEIAAHRPFRALQRRLQERSQRVDELSFRLQRAVQLRVQSYQRRVDIATTRVRHHDARRMLDLLRGTLQARRSGLETAVRNELARRQQRLDALQALLRERNPLNILQRGYALVYDAQGNVVRAAEQLPPGSLLRAKLASGAIEAEVKKTVDR